MIWLDRFIYKRKGSISIFLTIILLPTITFAGLIVDASRLNLARSMTSSAGDLTMNAALADYDSVLKDVYGLFAMSQNDPEKLQENLKAYFENTLIKSGVSPENSDSYTKGLIENLETLFSNPNGLSNPSDTTSFDNLLELKLEDGDFTAKPAPDSSLADPGVLKNQIVSYMKYRGPIHMGTSFLDALSAFGKINEQTEVVNKKLEADTALKDLNKACQEYYEALNTFDRCFNPYKDNRYQALIDRLKPNGDYEVIYRDIVTPNVLILFTEPPEPPDPLSLPATEEEVAAYNEKEAEYEQDLAAYLDKIQKAEAAINTEVSKISEFLTTHSTILGYLLTYIKDANDKAENVITAIEKYIKEIEKYENALNNYESSDEFKQTMEQDLKNKQNTFDPDEVGKITTALNNIQPFVEAVKDELEKKFKYGTTELIKITDADKAKQAVDSFVATDRTFEKLYQSGSLPADNTIKLIDVKPELLFYNYLIINFANQTKDQTVIAEQMSYNEEVNKKVNGTGTETETETESAGLNQTTTTIPTGDLFTDPKFSPLPSHPETSESIIEDDNVRDENKSIESESNSVFNSQSSIVTALFSTLKNITRNARDNLLVMDYATGMFSDNLANLTPNEPTISGIRICPEYNHFYGAEVEYILYGNPDPKINVFTAKAQIFAVRFVCNSIYALTDPELKAETFPLATAISAASCGTVPVIFAQGVILLSLALAESTFDMKFMAEGKKVAIFKDKNTWVMSFSGAANKIGFEMLKTAANRVGNEVANRASQVIQNFVDASAAEAIKMTAQLENSLKTVTEEKLKQAGGFILTQYSETIGAQIMKVTQQIQTQIDETANENDTNALVDQIFDQANAQIEIIIKNEKNDMTKNVEKWVYEEIICKNEETLKGQVRTAINDIKSNIKQQIENSVDEAQTEAYNIVKSTIDNITQEINCKLGTVYEHIAETIDEEINELRTKLNAAANLEVDKAKEEMLKVTNEYLDKYGESMTVGDGTLITKTEKKSSALKTMLAFGYKDYLKLFMFIKLEGNSDMQLKRIADLIQINIDSATSDKSPLYRVKTTSSPHFRMAKANTYVEIEAKLGLKTMFMNIPFVTSNVKKSGVGYLPINYKSVLGY